MRTTVSIGSNFTLSIEAIQVAVAREIIRDATKRGIETPAIEEIFTNGTIQFLDAEGNTVPLARVLVTVNDR